MPKCSARAVRRSKELLLELIAERRAAPDLDERDDVLSVLIRGGEVYDGTGRPPFSCPVIADHRPGDEACPVWSRSTRG